MSRQMAAFPVDGLQVRAEKAAEVGARLWRALVAEWDSFRSREVSEKTPEISMEERQEAAFRQWKWKCKGR